MVYLRPYRKKRKRHKDNEITVVTMSEDEIIRKVHIPKEMKGMELIELTKEFAYYVRNRHTSTNQRT